MFNGKRLKELRTQKGLTQAQLGSMVNVTKVSICCYEKETRMPSLDTFEDLAKVFGVDANYFLGHDVLAVSEDDKEYVVYLSKEELSFLEDIKKNKDLYKMIEQDPKRTVELIEKKLK